MIKDTPSVIIFRIFNGILLSIAAFLCLAPFMNLLAISFSSGLAVSTGQVGFVPVDVNFEAYRYVAGSVKFMRSFSISVIRVLLGVALNISVSILCAYPLSKNRGEFKQRSIYSWYFIISMLFVPSLIPS